MTKYYINYLTNETVAVPNATEYAHNNMLKKGFKEVSENEIDDYVKNHFND